MRWLPEIRLEEFDGPAPGEFRRGLIVARRRVVVESVVGVRVDMRRVFFAVLFERRLVVGPPLVDPPVELAVVDEQRRLYFGYIIAAFRLAAVERAGGPPFNI